MTVEWGTLSYHTKYSLNWSIHFTFPNIHNIQILFSVIPIFKILFLDFFWDYFISKHYPHLDKIWSREKRDISGWFTQIYQYCEDTSWRLESTLFLWGWFINVIGLLISVVYMWVFFFTSAIAPKVRGYQPSHSSTGNEQFVIR